ncbi:serine/threonine-protein kinase [Megavirus baoshan]|uniref:Serine/threonine-protein kinase n=1 Tax=Megavirus baoshan TaxID=2496520 RepID=A0A3S8UYX8_9VIRU|nr:serine/threonine-protein kinase [Megavirus baoshan]AZL89923.1 serine/threonine-protein kinase [Megavirus baoshan]
MSYFSYHPYLTHGLRSSIVDWMVLISDEVDLKSATLNLAVSIMDRYLAERKNISREKMKAVSICSLNLASKIEDLMTIGIENCRQFINYKYDTQYLIELEYDIIIALKCDLRVPTIAEYIKKIGITRGNNIIQQFFAYYLTNILLITIDYIYYDPETLAEAIINFSREIKNPLNFSESKFEIFVNENIINQYIYCKWFDYNAGKYQEINKKYNHNIFYNIAQTIVPTIVCDWKPNNFPDYFNSCYQINNYRNFYVYNNNELSTMPKNEILGKGTYGTVVKSTFMDYDIALKYTKCDEEIETYSLRELCHLIKLKHNNIVDIYGFGMNNKTGLFYISLELGLSSLFQKIFIKHETIREEDKIKYILQLLSAIDHMHKNKIMHRDLSVANIIIDKDNNLKVCDLGLSKYFYNVDFCKYSTGVCTITSRSIELLLDYDKYNEKIDIWSCACIIGVILRNNEIFKANKEQDAIDEIYHILGTPTELQQIRADYLRESMIDITPRMRIGFIDLEEKYPEETKIIYDMLDYDIKKRLTASESLERFQNIYKKK